ncbi:MAG TPA: hypothetical protein VK545_22765 [Streptomyces sp.]|nr:hypothetical protein [Streptomyces sp.]
MVGHDPGPGRPVCVVAGRDDATADPVILALHARDMPVVRLDLADFPRTVRLDAAFTGRGWIGTLAVGDHAVHLEKIRAVWWWHPVLCRVNGGLSAAEARWTVAESTAGLAGVLASLDCLQVNDPVDAYATRSRARMLTLAAGCGLRVPDTWIGNDPKAARDFAAASHPGVVCKALTRSAVHHPDGRRTVLRPRPVDPDDLDDSVTLSAHLLQRAVPTACNVRVVVVGDRAFAVRIDSSAPSAQWDARAEHGSLRYRAIDLPEQISRGVARLMDRSRLLYATLDFVVDTANGCWWLVSVNPAGRYDRIEAALPELGISHALADLLTHSSLPVTWRAA